MHDLPRTTDGARTILADFLRLQAGRHAEQRQRAARPLTLEDQGKTARVPAGSQVLIALDERRGQGYRWRVETVRGPGSCSRRVGAAADADRSAFDLKLNRPGLVVVTLAENRPLEVDSGVAEPRTFELRVIVEEEP
jgi:hypothetical protein